MSMPMPDLTFFGTGVLMGLGAGLTPGPITMLVVTQTLKHDLKEGMKVAFTPVLTDVPILLVTWLAFSSVAGHQSRLITAVISLVGAVFLLKLAKENLHPQRVMLDSQSVESPGSIRKGVIANFLSPHPYLFWMSVGTPMISRALSVNVLSALLYVVGMVGSVVFVKVILAIALQRSAGVLAGRPYRLLLQASGLGFLGCAGAFLVHGLKQFGWI
jgi:threonine/homoserine/homoserine lactone efflux protein